MSAPPSEAYRPGRQSTVEQILSDIAYAADLPLHQATSLPPADYHSQELFDLEVEQVLRPGWVAVARAADLAEPGDFRSVDLVGERLVLTKDRDGMLHALSRVCRHRSMPLVEGDGRARALQCPYHRWTYSLSGELVGAPYMDDPLLRTNCRLPEFACEEWGGFVFVNLDGAAPPLASQLAQLDDQLSAAGIDLAGQIVVDTTDWGECAWDWKVMVDNFMECYHHIGLHRESLQAAYPGELAWTDAGNNMYSLMHIVAAAEPPDSGDVGWPIGDPLRDEPSCLIHIYPLTLCSVRASGTNVLRVEPLGPGRIHLVTEMLAPASVIERSDFTEVLSARKEVTERVNREDLVACASVQKGLETPSATTGRLSPLEQTLWLFIRFLGKSLPTKP